MGAPREISGGASLTLATALHVSLIEDAYWSLWAQISCQPKLLSGVHCYLC